MRRTLVVLSCALLPLPAARAEDAKCCFTNPGHSGVCEVTPAKDETCAGILEYLNTPNSVGKSYCGGTTIRGGWQQATCKPESKPEGTAVSRAQVAGRDPAHERVLPAARP